MKTVIDIETISDSIYMIRNQKVMLDFDLASLYGVENRALKQQVRRNIERFPDDFMFELTREEWNEQVTNCDSLKKYKTIKATPFAFTEQGVAMLSSVLKNKRAVEINIAIMRAFVNLRKLAIKSDEITRKLLEIEKNSNLKFLQYDEQFRVIMDVIQQMTIQDEEENSRRIGFNTEI